MDAALPARVTRPRSRLSGRHVAVTGGGGFIGSHVVTRLVAEAADVVMVGGLRPERPWVSRLVSAGRVRHVEDGASFAASLPSCDSVVHLAYASPRSSNPQQRLGEERLNVRATERLLAVAAEARVACFCFSSTTSVYPPIGAVTEATPPSRPLSAYATAKLEQEELVQGWAAEGGRRCVILRLSTVYGPGETSPRAIPRFLAAMLAGRPPVVAGAGRGPFDPVYVGDVAHAVVCALASGAGGVFNVGTGVARRPSDVAALVARLSPVPLEPEFDAGGEDRACPICDVSRAARDLDFRAKVPLRAGILREAAWMRSGMR